MLSPNLSISYKLWRAGMHSAPSNHPKSVIFWQKKSIPRHRGRSKSKAVSQKWHSRIFLNGGGGFLRVKLPKISCLFDNNLSLGVGGLQFKSPYLKNDAVENYLDGAVASSKFKCPKISLLFDKNLSPGGRGSSQSIAHINDAVKIFLEGAVSFSTFNCPKISHLFDKFIPRGGRGKMLSPSLFPNLTLLIVFGML
jgi:hypothetical protein